ncbi:MAG: tetratricopeptide repeat protein [Bacteroidia bacterium]|nr:tetratricopeptide repeat protein [Bacteroidia bacterium]
MKNNPHTLIAVGLVLAISFFSGCSNRTSQALNKTQSTTDPLMNEAKISKELIEQQAEKSLQVMPVTTNSDRARLCFEKARKFRHDFTHLSESHDLLKQAIALDPEFALAWVYLSMHYSTAGDKEAQKKAMEQAQLYAEKASKGEKMFVEAMLQGPASAEIWKSLEQMYPDDKYIHLILGYIYKNNLQDYPGALAQFQKSLALDGTLGNAYNMIGYTYIALEQYGKAEEAFKTYMELFPHSGNPYDSMGDLYMKLERYEEAIALYEKAYSVEPAFTWSAEKARETRQMLAKNMRR